MLSDRQISNLLSKLIRFEQTLEKLVFTTIGQLDASYFQTSEQCYSIPEQSKFSPCEKGTVWGEEYGYCWFYSKYEVPETYNGQALYLYPKTGGSESLLWVNDKPFGTFCTKIVVTGHGNHYCDMLVKNAVAGETIEVALEVYAGHHVKGCMPFENTGLTNFSHVFQSLDVCVKNDAIASFLFDLKTLNQAARVLDKTSFRRADIINTLMHIHEILYYDVDNVDHETFMAALSEAHEILRPKLAVSNSASAPFAGLIGHSHMDTAWLWHIDETIKKCARTYSNQLNLMEQYEEYKFIQSSAYHSEVIRQHYPALFADIQQKVSEGRYEPNGGVWIECDCNITSGESMIRQFLWGQLFTRKYFNYTANTFWLPDTFGYSASIPQIMKGCGVDYFMTTKMAWNDTTKFPYDTFYWQGLDGTKVLTHLNKTHIWPDAQNLIEYVSGWRGDDTIQEKTVSNMRLLSYGFGDGGGGPQFEMIEMSRRVKDFEGVPRSEHITVGDFMKRMETSIVNPSTHSGELYLELHRGTLTNQHTIKRNNRLAEIALHDLEYATVLQAQNNSTAASGEAIRPLMNTVLVNQFHDILPGTCIPRVHEQSRKEMAEIIDAARTMTKERLSANNSADTVTILNSLSFERHDVVVLDARDGYMVAEYKQQSYTDLYGAQKIAISGVTLPPFSSVALSFVKGQAANGDSPFTYEQNVLQTPFAIVVFDEKGYIFSFIDKSNGRELRGEGYAFNTFLIAEDLPSAWDNWDIDVDIESKFKDTAKLVSRECVSDGAVEYRIRSLYQISSKSTIKQDMVFFADSPEVRFETIMDWNDDHRLLKTAFDTSIYSDFARHEIQFGYLKRPTTRNNSEEKAKFEVSNHKYTDLSESRYGAAILNDCKYGISVKGSQMRLTLHKGGCRPDFYGDKGQHECVYAFLPHNAGFSAESVIQPAYALNYKPIVVNGAIAMQNKPFVQISNDNIMIEAIKPCEETQNAYILRLYDAEGTYTRTTLSLCEDAKQIEITNMLEESLETLDCKNHAELVFRPFEIKTVKVTYK